MSYTNGVGKLSWTGWNTNSAVIKADSSNIDDTTINVWDKFELPFDNIVENISFVPVSFDPYLEGATLGQLTSTLQTHSFGLTNTNIFEVSQSQLKLKDDFYYDPQLNEFVNITNGNFYSIGEDDNLGIISYQSSSKDINFVDDLKISDLLKGVQNSTIPYFAGSPVSQKPLSGETNIDALLSLSNDSGSSVLFWDNNKNYLPESGITTITYSFVPSDENQKFASNYTEPNPNVDEIKINLYKQKVHEQPLVNGQRLQI